MDSRVCVTGASGLLGSYLCVELLKAGRSVRALRRPTSNLSWFNRIVERELGENREELMQHFSWIEGDVTDVVSLEEAFESCSEIYHAAALVSFAKKDRRMLDKVNVLGTANVINVSLAMSSKPNVCFVSSTATMGKVENSPVDETISFNHDDVNSYYSKTKYDAELEAIRGREEGLNVAIINPCIILGFGNWNTGSAGFFKNARNGFPFYTGGTNAFVDVRDVASCSRKLMDMNLFDGRYLCTGWNKKFVKVFRLLANEFDSKPPRIEVKPLMAEIAWRISGILQFFTGNGLITKESARAGLRDVAYSSERLKTDAGHTFHAFEDAMKYHVAGFIE